MRFQQSGRPHKQVSHSRRSMICLNQLTCKRVLRTPIPSIALTLWCTFPSVPQCAMQHTQICQCPTCNFSSSHSKLPSLPRYLINDLGITVEQKIGTRMPWYMCLYVFACVCVSVYPRLCVCVCVIR